MPAQPILFYGSYSLEAQVFQTYMASSGYQVQILSQEEAVRDALATNPAAMTVISLDKPPEELVQVVSELCGKNGSRANHIFILTGERAFNPEMPRVHVITRPFRLVELIEQIRKVDRPR